MKAYLVKTPQVIKSLYKDYIWELETGKKEVFLTFDDGPTPIVTNFVLDELKKHQAKATFFCIGKNIDRHPDICKQIISEGHSIGNHTHNHLNCKKHLLKDYIGNVLFADKSLAGFLTPNAPKLFRPPYGRISRKASKELIKQGYKIIMWDVLSADFDLTNSAKKCIENVQKHIKPGSIIVFHDSKKSFPILKKVLPEVLSSLSKENYNCRAL
ncbi:polysaccharide deacetylase family protein [Galbibacter sp. PAP.153]|uniref:polysaccharide deacetylase family protein n=1 Tax=Galbibacter sp. PAP.153 TaxID=3104623 RepID=UPI00300A9D4E